MKLTPEMKEIALNKFHSLLGNYQVDKEWFIRYLEAFLEALPKPEPVGMFYYDGDGKWIQSTKELPCKEPLQYLYTSPPATSELEAQIQFLRMALADTEALELGTAERCTKLEAQNTALLITIKEKDNALSEIKLKSISLADAQVTALEALALSPSAELLEARDRKRDAKLFKAACDEWVIPSSYNREILALATKRESGEWIPELGD